MPLNLDFGEVGKLPPEGTYLVKCIKAEIKSGKEAPYIATQYEIQAPTMVGFKNLFLNLSVAPQSLWATQRNLEALTGREFREDNMAIDEQELPGLICGAIITHGEYNGAAKAEIANLVPEEIGQEAVDNYVPEEEFDEGSSTFGMSFDPNE